MTSNDIRKAFLDFFEKKGHHVVPSAPMVIKNDPTLMFTNAGMNQFKDIFLGNSPAQYKRVCDSQKCLRVSGKHNDLEEVGHDTYHHTMFEMLGNWSFGDYFKKEAIAYAWEFLTEVMKIDRDNLYVTVFGGDEKEGLTLDSEAYDFWKEHVGEDRIILGSKKDNFWEMGEQGPCGPCSEIHIDLREENEKRIVAGRDLVNKDNPLVIEIWNLVFMQYNRLSNGTLEPLKSRHIDTGMGFERLCMVMQNKKSNYDTDIFQPLIVALAEKAGVKYGENENTDIALRVCADHLRAVAFSIADGQLPSNAKAGYVIRRILRRAVRYGYTFLGFKEPFLNDCVSILVEQMGGQFVELKQQQELIRRIIKEEECSFLKTLANGIVKFENYVETFAGKNNNVIDGAFAFELFDTYGFPIDLTQLMASEKGWTVDMDGFNKGLGEQKNRSRAAAAVENDDWVVLNNNDEEQFLGYDTLEAEVSVSRYRHVRTKDKSFYQLVFNVTPFYGESGGQVGDTGVIVSEGETVRVIDTKKENNLIVHIVEHLPAVIEANFIAKVDVERRAAIQRNHSATHLLHKALREVLGTHVEQKGSSVDSQRLRFDFSHFAKMSKEELREVERRVNDDIRKAIPLEETRAMPIDEARSLGAMALFGEKYGEYVRVVKFGDSIEFCGGTHVSNTGAIGTFRIVSEGAVAAGMRRIEAVSGNAAEQYVDDIQDTLEQVKEMLRSPKDIVLAIAKLQEENTALRNEIVSYQKEKISKIGESLAKELSETAYLHKKVDYDLMQLKDVVMDIRQKHQGMALVLGSNFGGKPQLLVCLGQELVDRGMNAGTIIRSAGKEIQGGGGGQPAYATAGGKNVDGLDNAISVAWKQIAG